MALRSRKPSSTYVLILYLSFDLADPRSELIQRIMSYIDSGKEAGARVQVGGERHGDKGFFIKPTVFTDVTPDMKIVREEIFGPVGVVIKFKTEEGMRC